MAGETREPSEFEKMDGLGDFVLAIGKVVKATEEAAKTLNTHPETVLTDVQACFELRGLKFVNSVYKSRGRNQCQNLTRK